MKKLLSIVLILVLSLSCFSLASCDKEEFTKEQLEAYENYTNALKKTNELDDLDGKLDMIISMNVQGTRKTVSYAMMTQGISAKLTLTVEYFNLGKSVTVEPIEGYQSFPEQIIGG